MSDSDLIQLYSARILDLAANIPHLGRLPAPDATARKRSPLCGSTVTVDVVDVKACALGQAAAAVVGQAVIGQTLADLTTARDGLKAMLTDTGPVPAAPFAGFEVLLPARAYKNRHASILLALDATCEAVAEAKP